MDSTKSNYFAKEIRVLKFVGVSITGNEGIPYTIFSFILLVPTVVLYPSLCFYEYFKHDISAIEDIIIYQIGTFLGFCKVAIVLLNRVKIRKLLAKLEQEPFIPNRERGGQVEEEIVNECVQLTTKQTYIFWAFAAVPVISALFGTAIIKITREDFNDWQMPFGTFTLFNATYSTGFELNWLYQGISCICIAVQYITIDLILAAALVHITYQFKVLQNVIKQLVETARKKMIADCNSYNQESCVCNETEGFCIPWKYLQKSVKEAVEYHVAIIEITKEVEQVFSYLLLIVFLGTLGDLCFSTYAASSTRMQQSAIKHVIEGLVACMQVATICFWGEQVSQESFLVAKAAYESNFVGTDLRFQNMVAMIICRSQIPIKFSAGKFADISFATFAWILRASYSSFMVLRRRNN